MRYVPLFSHPKNGPTRALGVGFALAELRAARANMNTKRAAGATWPAAFGRGVGMGRGIWIWCFCGNKVGTDSGSVCSLFDETDHVSPLLQKTCFLASGAGLCPKAMDEIT